jgi:carbon-monoxide dehydrogenase large subunit
VKLAEKLRNLAAGLLDTTPDDVELDDGRVRLRDDPDRGLSFVEMAEVAYLKAHLLPKDLEPGLSVTATFDVFTDGTFGNATHGVVVELHEGTGRVEILRYVCVEDCGWRSTRWSSRASAGAGSPRASRARCSSRSPTTSRVSRRRPASWTTRCPPRARSPTSRSTTWRRPAPSPRSGAKGVGEGGTIGAPAAVLNAVNDALAHTGVELNDTPIARETVQRALEQAS